MEKSARHPAATMAASTTSRNSANSTDSLLNSPASPSCQSNSPLPPSFPILGLPAVSKAASFPSSGRTERSNQPQSSIQVVELDMMDRKKYFPLTLASGMAVRGLLYPLTLVKTRLQIQKNHTLYKGTFDAFRKIVTHEGVKGLYRGFWINASMVIPQMTYITTYESVRQFLLTHSDSDSFLYHQSARSFLAGGTASIVSQTFIVPIDIVTQHLMLLGQHSEKPRTTPSIQTLESTASDTKHSGAKRPRGLDPSVVVAKAKHSSLGAPGAVIGEISRLYGIRGFWKGYTASLMVYVPNSAMWWLLYGQYSEKLAYIAPEGVPRLAIQCVAAPLGGMTATILTNPLDAVRARLQVKGHGTIVSTAVLLWEQERWSLFTKALVARMVSSSIFSFCIVFGYESVKRLSLLEEHKEHVRW